MQHSVTALYRRTLFDVDTHDSHVLGQYTCAPLSPSLLVHDARSDMRVQVIKGSPAPYTGVKAIT